MAFRPSVAPRASDSVNEYGGIRRRVILAGAGTAAAVGAVLGGLRGCRALQAADGGSVSDALRLIREAVQASPDHLAARAAELVAAKDAGRIVAFVRDQISVVPSLVEGADPESARIGGSAAVLRSGSGTLRDRAQLLAELLDRAGFSAEVRSANRPDAITQPVLYQLRKASFEPDAKRLERAQRILADLGYRPVEPSSTAPATGLLPALTAVVPVSDRTHQGRADLLPASVPVVRYDDRGTIRYAFALGDLAPTTDEPAGLGPAPEPAPYPAIGVAVFGIANPARGSQVPRGEPIPLVNGSWAATAVLGRQVLLTFVPPQGAQALLAADPADLPLRVPTLRVQVAERDRTPKELISTGAPMTAQGEVFGGHGEIKVSTRGLLSGPFGPIKPLTAAARATAMSRAKSVEVAANAAAFGEIELDVAVLDGDGRSVEGLDAKAFVVTEEGGRVASISLSSNAVTSKAPRVLVAYDASPSVLSAWPSEQARTRFEQGLATTLTAAAAQTPFDLQVLGLGTAPNPATWRKPATEEVLTALQVADPQSTPWHASGGPALDMGAVAVVLVSDFRSDEEPARIKAWQRRLVASGVPVFCLPIGELDEKTIKQIVDLSGGVRLDPKHPSTARRLADLIRPLAARRTASIYRMRYTAPVKGPAKRHVRVTLDTPARPAGADTYVKPTDPVAPPSFVGLYAEISIDGQKTTQRLAGLPIKASGGEVIGDLDDRRAVTATRAAIYGVTTMAFESGTPTTAALLDELLATYLSVEPLRSRWKSSTAEQLVKAVGPGILRTPGHLPEFQPTDGIAESLRVTILQERQPAPDRLERHLLTPALPVGQVAVGIDPAGNLDALLASSIRQVTVTGTALPTQPLTRLAAWDTAGRTAYVQTVPGPQRTFWAAMLDQYTDHHLLVPQAGRQAAFWAVHQETGRVVVVPVDPFSGTPSRLPCRQPATLGGLSLAVSLLDPNSPLLEIPGVGPVDLNAVVSNGEPINQRITFGHAAAYLGAAVPPAAPGRIAQLLRSLECSE